MEQTNRTMLFEQINPDKCDLLTMITESEIKQSLTDEDLIEIHRELEISSFQQFVEKFDPTVHMLLDTDNCTVKFSRNHLGPKEEKISIHSKDSLFQMILYIMESKKRKKYILTGFCDLLENMIPKESAENFIQSRNQIMLNIKKRSKQVTIYQKEKVQQLMKQYDDGLFLLMTFIQNIHDMLDNDGMQNVLDKAILSDDSQMQVQVIKRADRYKHVPTDIGENQLKVYKQCIQDCIASLKEKNALVHTQLMEDCFLLPIWLKEKNYHIVQERYELYSQLYKNVLQQFWIVAKPIIETTLGIKEFFEQYKHAEGMEPRIVVGNFLISDLLEYKNREKLEAYLNTVNSKNYYKDTIWYAIVPNLASAKQEKRVVREIFLSRQEKYTYPVNKAEEVALLLQILGEYHIQSFVSMANTEENTFSAFAQKGIDGINESLNVLEHIEEKDYMIPCFPNFVVVPQEQACICIGKVLEYDELEEKLYVNGDRNVWFDSIGIEASYVAAGLVAACQCPKYLKECFGKKVDENLPGVAYRFSQNENNRITTSDMLSEATEFTEEILNEAIDKSRGILFGQYQGKMIILTDRVFSYNRSNRLLLSMIQTITYIERIIQYETQDYKKNLIIQFFQRRPGSIISQWYSGENTVVNGILKQEEELQYQIMEEDKHCVFELHFNNSDLVRKEKVSIVSE